MSLDWLRLALVLCFTGALAFASLPRLRDADQRLMLGGMLAGLLFYSGLGGAYPEVALRYLLFYMLFAVAVVAGFHACLGLFRPLGDAVGRSLPRVLANVDHGRVWLWLILVYVLLAAFPLIWPELRLQLLLHPSAPDLRTSFDRQFNEQPDAVMRLATYAHLLLTPFFLIALYRLRNNLGLVTGLLMALLYLDYVANSYVGRGEVMLSLGLVVLAGWALYPRYRRKLLAGGLLLLPGLVYGLYIYGVLRQGGSPGQAGLLQALDGVLSVEWGFPRDVGMPLIEAGARVDLGAYFTWIATLPLPKLITGPVEGARINYEISTLMLGGEPGDGVWYVVLPGIVAESVYVYGSSLFWLHGLFVGGMAAFLVRLLQRTSQLLFLRLSLVLLLAYALNRGGIGSVLPELMNAYLLFYVFVAWALWHCTRRRGWPAGGPGSTGNPGNPGNPGRPGESVPRQSLTRVGQDGRCGS